MHHSTLRLILSMGTAIFSMFFGAGNVVFPIALGQQAGEQFPWAMAGLMLTAIGGPLLGLYGTILFKGDYHAFFDRGGKLFGSIVIIIAISLLGPFAVLPRCVLISYGALSPYFPALSLPLFSFLFGGITFICIVKQRKVIALLGNILSPLLLCALVMMIIGGILTPASDPAPRTALTENAAKVSTAAFIDGLLTGYDTMDLLAAIFFAGTIWRLLEVKLDESKQSEISRKKLSMIAIGSGVLGGSLLALIYLGLSGVANKHPTCLSGCPPEQLITMLSQAVLGTHLSAVASIAVALACLTTVISLTITFAHVVERELEWVTLPTKGWLALTVVTTTVFANMGFEPIMAIIHPLVVLFYPSVIVLTVCNIAYKVWGIEQVRFPVYVTLATTLFFTLTIKT